MSQLLKLSPSGATIARALPEGAFKPAPAANPKPDLALVNAGQGDGRPKIKPNVPWATEPTVTHWEGGAFVRLAAWLDRANDPVLAQADGVGVIIMSHEDPLALEGHLEGIGLIAVDFSRFSDGRGNSIANLLRTRLGWHKEVRAVGDVLIDQLFFMGRCGFDSFALRDGQNVDRAVAAFHDFPHVYQNNADGRGFVLGSSGVLETRVAA
jgi:uncharacterized protein (DUF934 family)